MGTLTTIEKLEERLQWLISQIGAPNQTACHTLWRENRDRFIAAWGSSHNHQAWPGGYLGHVVEVMEIACKLYPAMMTHHDVPFTLPDALLVLYVHDLEKPWRHVTAGETSQKNPTLTTKVSRATFRRDMIRQYEISLTPEQENALQYVEGENDDYDPKRRVMNELAAFVHMCDVASARIWHDYPK